MAEKIYNVYSTDEELAGLCAQACQNLDPEMILFDAKCAVYNRLSSKIEGLVSFPVFHPWRIEIKIEFPIRTFECVLEREKG